ncbi:hypothetical protein VOLCADRAFT_94820 [Volvox carteri f. nagariensis]|uniref:Transmembrane protein 186 n=1 Tax=Volvox carteri f. nagariensis TaxID=3068 RepID=D8U5U9_VOLCA|nr:uncharacterized protein VOLCADRAFT_94820 [Volvox carteri f. nagariensis]EFJ44750.1 hypothetical protein VOLCADRAFT_94820 [Volvox carteri f. nagariensis]|eukprot:XP_002954033.1 hypothetical protein VOLCADRAFT_94820 [Volvox carteri f. nagariensis]
MVDHNDINNCSRTSCLHGRNPGFRPSGLPRLLAPGAISSLIGLDVINSISNRQSLSSNASPLAGLKLQTPSNPFAPRKPRPTVQKLVLYRGRGMLLFRFIVRAKVFQLMGFLACAVFASVVLTTSNPNPMDLAAVGALAVGCVVTSYCIWYYSGRYVGEMSLLLPERRVVRFSVLDFWGNREDNDVPLEQVVAPWRNRSVAEVRSQARQALMPVEVAGDRQYYISVPHGHLLQKEILQKILYGAPIDANAEAKPTEAPGETQAAAGTRPLGDSPTPKSLGKDHEAGKVDDTVRRIGHPEQQR